MVKIVALINGDVVVTDGAVILINCDMVFICLGRPTKQIMEAKFQTLMFLFANTESSPNSSKRLLPVTAEKIKGRSLRKDCQMTGALIFVTKK
jgi:hypothetical protein